MRTDRREYLRKYLNEWRRKRKAKDLEEGITAPLSEGQLRRRACRECGDPVEAKSYWFCNDHNRLSGESDDLHYSSRINTDTYE